MVRRLLISGLAVASMLVIPVKAAHAQEGGCSFVEFECAYSTKTHCATCDVGFAVYDCGGTYDYVP